MNNSIKLKGTTKMKKKIFSVFLSVCLMISCVSFAFADSLSNEKNDDSSSACRYVLASANEHDYSECEYDYSEYENERDVHSSPACGYVLASANEHDYSECELVMSAIDDVTYELATPDGKVVGTLYMDSSENAAVPYSISEDVDWLVPQDNIAHSTTYFDTTYGSLGFNYTISAVPKGDTKFGFYCSANKTYYWSPGLQGSVSGYFPVSQGFGLVAFAIKNESNHSIRYIGSYTV